MITFKSETAVCLPMTFDSPEQGIELVKQQERAMDRRLTDCASAISADCVAHGVRVIRLSGPTCVGKTTAAHKLTEALEAAGRVVHPISIDDFYYGRDVLHRMAEESGSQMVISDLNLSIKAGQTLALVGPSGGGKSTICNLIPRFYTINSGKITLDGIDTKDIRLESLREKIGIVSQNIFLFDGTVKENIAYGTPDATDDEIIDAAKKPIYTISY